jgi:hypothetical protein
MGLPPFEYYCPVKQKGNAPGSKNAESRPAAFEVGPPISADQSEKNEAVSEEPCYLWLLQDNSKRTAVHRVTSP